MFWGLIMEPQRRYTQKVKKAFHISMAALDVSTSSEEPAQIMVGFEGRNYLLCTLKKPDMLQCPLDLNFEVGDELSLAANGKCHVHLTGYLIEDPNDLLGEEEVEEEETQEQQVKKKNKKRNKLEIQNGLPIKKSKTSSQEENSENDDSEEDDSDIDVGALLGKTLESDEEDDETFGSDDGESDVEEEADEVVDLEEEEEEESSLSDTDSDEETAQNVTVEVQTPNKQKDKKEKKNEQKKQQLNQHEGKTPNKENQSPKGKELIKKVLQNGLIIEDLKEGQGQPAKAGKFVSVYYEGRLKSNNKLFDSTNKGAGFSFRLGGGEVIKGWDTGLVGMKVGGKRRITCPPKMAYGNKGSPPAIPANATLIFEVELKKIR